VLRLLMGVLLCVSIGMCVALLTGRGIDSKAPVSVWQIVMSAVSFQGATVVLVWWFVRDHGMSWSEAFGLGNANSRAIAIGVLAAIVFFPLGGLLQRISIEMLNQMGVGVAEQSAVEALRRVSHGTGLLVFALITVILAPVGEELLFRGILYPAIKRAGFPLLAGWGTSLLFAVIHFNRAIFLPLLLLSLLLVWLYEHTDNFLAPLTTHVLFNAANLAFFFVNNETRPDLSV